MRSWRPCLCSPVIVSLILFVLFIVIAATTTFQSVSVVRADTASTLFADVSVQAGIVFEQTLKYAGPCIADLDQDGYYDLVLSNHNKKPAQLYWNNRNGTFFLDPKPVARWDVHGIAAGDYDLDGDLDVLVTKGGANGLKLRAPEFYELNDRSLTERTHEVGLDAKGMRGRSPAWIDIDGDGDLDLVLVNFQKLQDIGPQQIVYENLGNKKFKYHTGGQLAKHKNERVTVVDFNSDNKLDLILYHDLAFFKNNGDFTFTDVSREVKPPDRIHLVLAVAEIDYDNDGDFDLYLARGWGQSDVLLENQGGVFKDMSESAKLPKGGWHSGATVGDFNNDGYEDVFVYRRTKDGPRLPDLLLINNGNGTFETTTEHGAIVPPWDGHGNMGQAFDYDLDGRLDILTGSEDDGTWRLFRNQHARTPNAHYLLVRVGRSWTNEATALGALVTLNFGGQVLRRRVGSAGAGHSQSQLDIVHLGLGSFTVVDKIHVRWSNGQSRTREKVAVDQLVTFGIV